MEPQLVTVLRRLDCSLTSESYGDWQKIGLELVTVEENRFRVEGPDEEVAQVRRGVVLFQVRIQGFLVHTTSVEEILLSLV